MSQSKNQIESCFPKVSIFEFENLLESEKTLGQVFDVLLQEECTKNQDLAAGPAGINRAWCFYMHLKPNVKPKQDL